MRSLTVGIPNGLVLPSPFGMSTRLTACGLYVPSRSAADSSDRYSSAFAANRSMLCPSTPAAPLLARTFIQASISVLGANTLSIKLNHLPPLTPFASADSIRSVHTAASAPAILGWASASCAAVSGIPDAFCASAVVFTSPPSCPTFPRPGLCYPCLSDRLGPTASVTMRALTPADLAHTRQVSPLPLPCRPSIPTPNHIVCLDIAFTVTSAHRDRSRDPGFAELRQARHNTPPKRVRHPTGCSFASGCSPPRITATQLPSAT